MTAAARVLRWSRPWAAKLSLLLGLVLAFGIVTPRGVRAGPPPMDPRQMSGIPRPDPQIEGGTITVRVLRGSFDAPALQHPVQLELTGADGIKKETQTVQTANQGRATFKGLASWAGGRAIAKVELDGETLTSAPIDIRGDIGTAVMLVSVGAPQPQAQETPSGMPMPGTVFPFDRVAPGELMVGAFDLEARKAMEGLEVTLIVEAPEGEPTARKTTRTKVTDPQGKVVFGGLDALPKGTKFTAEATLSPGEPAKRSETFERIEGKGMGVVLAKGILSQAHQPEAASAQTAPRRRVPGPRILPGLPQGTVRVHVIDGYDAPVPEQDVVVVMRDASQTETTFAATTDAAGDATVAGVDVRSDAFYFVRVVYDQGPYRSGFFQMDKQGGIAVDMRVFQTTQDPAAMRSALQFEVRGSENDMAQVFRVYEVAVQGDKAFWVPGGMKMYAPEAAKSVTVLRPSERWLDHEGKAPFVTLSRPIPPGTSEHLSIAWVEEHDGTVELEWHAPFEVVQSSVLIDDTLTLNHPGATKSDRKINVPDASVWDVPPTQAVSFSISGLPIRNPVFRILAFVIGFSLMLVAIIVIVVGRHDDPRTRLERRRDALLALLANDKPPARRDRIVAALDRTYRLLDGLGGTHGPASSAKARPRSLPPVALLVAVGGWLALVVLATPLLFPATIAALHSGLLTYGIAFVGPALMIAAGVLLNRLDRRVVPVTATLGVLLLANLGAVLAGSGDADLETKRVLTRLAVWALLYGVLVWQVLQLRAKGTLS